MFFKEVRPQSTVKKVIVTKYFNAWATIMNKRSKSDRLGYIDLFCGPGKYDDGTESTPITIMKTILSNENYRNKFITVFNDKDKKSIEDLKKEIYNLPNISQLEYDPIFLNEEVNFEMSKLFGTISLIPSLIFIDPWGYAGVTRELIYSLAKNWGCDIILFFNYNRIRSGLKNQRVKIHMEKLFGQERFLEIHKNLNNYKGFKKEKFIINEFSEGMKELGINYILPFRFKKEDKNDTSHYLIFLSKNFVAYNIMKEIMANESSSKSQGVASFEYIPNEDSQLSFLYMYSTPLEELGNGLLQLYKGKSIKFYQLFCEHSINRPFVKKNYRDIILKLEKEGKVTCDPVERRKNTLGDDVIIKFPDNI